MNSKVSNSKIENFRNLKDQQSRQIIRPFISERSEREDQNPKKNISPNIIKPGKQNQNRKNNFKTRQRLENEQKNASISYERENVQKQTKLHPMVQHSILHKVANPNSEVK
jgi:predicted amidophosphoribosyltransferase